MQIPKLVLVTDVVTRDGFQNEDRIVSTEDKLRVIEGLVRAGVTSIEVTSFVHPAWFHNWLTHLKWWLDCFITRG